ncbi:hypothetical protein ACQR5V_17305 [Xanthomonas oryzae pv. oryzicola]|uniref:hypothetical protein n=1 Tax=Xanthomonas oryzae TaxID=347 RepID=UPI000169380F|nr:hypothetical protein [Xanthomonas oryzae]AJQ87340.1 hypothetical protein BE73_09745 [Xanthomonas oryzae pv. oryzicola]AKK63820.1 hypothetical protein FE36_08180 [Xanthomonas oryzae pv. oryzicola]AKN93627.1 hypothetical protein ACU13_11880 [Xanthomonas oryzae pv. oryzicola]AKN97358.1 hypothetical protein ACU10_11825 [Xanthomonas oryzae pv. oryzicola]AKO01047.1 hypothetical protein ACU15_11620 [Xanthomonas oryzae pv. oryzicola]
MSDAIVSCGTVDSSDLRVTLSAGKPGIVVRSLVHGLGDDEVQAWLLEQCPIALRERFAVAVIYNGACEPVVRARFAAAARLAPEPA